MIATCHMQLSLQMRITLYVLALVLAASAFLAGGIAIWKKRNRWQRELLGAQTENVTMAQDFKAEFRGLNAKLLSYEFSRDPKYRDEFTTGADRLAQWLESRSAEAQVKENREILRQLSGEFAHYRKAIEPNLAARQVAGRTNISHELFDLIEAATPPILALDDKLSANQQTAFSAFVTRARRDMDVLFRALYFCMMLLLGCVALLARVVYRDWIAPLQRIVIAQRAQLERQEKLSALGLLAAGLAHEIHNPLNSIKARLWTQRRLLGEVSPGLEDNKFIDEEVDRLEGIVSDTLQFARPSAPVFQRLRLVSALKPICEMLEPSLCKSGIRLETDFQTDAEISADLNQLKQVLLNLVNNAAESIDRNGAITLRTRATTFRRGRKKTEAIAIEITDTGKGISHEARKRLFDPFFTTKDEGTGLGLSITARIVEAHGGIIECESPSSGGALFRIILPLS